MSKFFEWSLMIFIIKNIWTIVFSFIKLLIPIYLVGWCFMAYNPCGLYNAKSCIYIYAMEVNNGKNPTVWRKTEKQSNPMWWIYYERKSTPSHFRVLRFYYTKCWWINNGCLIKYKKQERKLYIQRKNI